MLGILINLKFIFKVYSRKMKLIFICIIFLVLLNAIGEIFTIISIKPLLNKIISSKNIINQTNDFLFLGFDDQNMFLISLILIISLFIVLSLKIINLWIISRFSAKTGTLIATNIFNKNVLSKYYNFNNFDSSFITSTLTTQLEVTVTGLINIFRLFSSLIICLFIFTGLLINNFRYNLLITFFFSSVYILIYLLVKNRLSNNSFIIKNKSQTSLKIIKDGFGANKEIIANNLQSYFKDKFIKFDWEGRKAKATNYVLKLLPRSIIEFLAFTLIISICLITLYYEDNSIPILVYVGSLAFAFQRLMPQMQCIFASWSYISGEKASIQNILNLLKKINNQEFINRSESIIKFKNINLVNVCFSYKSPGKKVFDEINLKINKGDKIGIIGQNGSGKSTLIDLLTGTIKPVSGRVLLNGIDIHQTNNEKYLYQWRNSFSLLTQNPYFLGNSILENIAFGENLNEIDLNKVYESAKKAKIYDFIESLPDKFLTNIGERGSKLSGGQAQRIGIARAIYKNKNILIMDESTSSLDENTENELITSLREITSEMTLIIISHRKQILEICEKLINLD